MTTTLTGSDSYSNTATAPADGDLRNASSVNTPMQTVLNNTRYLYKHGRIIAVTTDSGLMSGTTSASYTTADSWSVASCEVGDVVIAITAMTLSWNSDGAVDTDAQAKISFTEDGVEYNGKIVDTASTSTSASTECTLLGARTVATAGTVTVAVKTKVGSADGTQNYTDIANNFTVVLHVRP